MVKETEVKRVPKELIVRIDQYGKLLEQSGIRMNQTDLMRNFAENAVTPKDDIKRLFGVLNKASKKE